MIAPLTDEQRERIGDRRVIASVSGGKDSAAMSLWLHENGVEHERVFLDTGWEHPATYEYLRGPLTEKLGPIHEARGRLGKAAQVRIDALLLSGKLRPRVRAALLAGSLMVALILAKGMFPSKRRRFCTQELKVFAMQAYLSALIDDGADVINCVGIRRDESEARSQMSEWDYSDGFDCEVWRPLVAWPADDVIAIHKRHGLAPNPLYLRGASRVGCWPCIYQRKSEIRFMADDDPERIELLRELELDVFDLARDRATARGEEVASPPSWFQAPIGGGGECWSIDRVVEWSRTLRGGKVEDRRLELFAGMNDGCMRWGLCETSAPEDAALTGAAPTTKGDEEAMAVATKGRME